MPGAKGGKTKHDRCVEGVRESSPHIENPHAVCVSAGVEPSSWKKSLDEEVIKIDEKGQWSIEVAPKDSNNKKTYEKEFKKSEDLDDELELSFYDDGDLELVAGADVPDEYFQKTCEYLEKKDWSPKAKHKSKSGGLTQAGVESYRRANPGSKLKTAVTESKPKGKRAKRRKSFCARNKGQIDMHNIDCRKDPKKRACLARKKWRCRN